MPPLIDVTLRITLYFRAFACLMIFAKATILSFADVSHVYAICHNTMILLLFFVASAAAALLMLPCHALLITPLFRAYAERYAGDADVYYADAAPLPMSFRCLICCRRLPCRRFFAAMHSAL